MASEPLRSRLLAVLAADAAGYSRSMAENERATVEALDRGRAVFREAIATHGGRVIDTAGDSVMSVFETALGAVQAALAVQQALASNASAGGATPLRFRIGVHVGDVLEKADGTVYGDGVNIAARLEGLAKPGAVAVSGIVHELVAQRVDAVFDDIGEQSVKNIARPIRVFQIRPTWTADSAPAPAMSYRFDGFTVDIATRALLSKGAPLAVGERALSLLLALLAAPERKLSKAQILDAVWPGADVEENNIATQVSALRRLLGAGAIATVPGFGYRLTSAVVEVAGADAIEAAEAAAAADDAQAIRLGPLELRPSQRQALLDGRPLEIGSRAYDMLAVLVEERHRVVTKRELLERVWPGLVVEENNLQVQVSSLRRLLGQQAIATVPGRGYRFTPAIDEPQPPAPLVPPAPSTTHAAPRRTNLPAAAEALIGRAAELAALRRMVTEQRLVTVLGAGGIGKTRISLAAARDALAEHAGGVWWIDLAPLSNEAEVAPAIAACAGQELGGGDAVAQLAQAFELRGATLLVLDNCEHLVAGVGQLARALLGGASKLRLLCTSQVPLHIEGEQLFRVEPLAVPPAGTELVAARTFGALLLLERRAQAVQSSFAITAATLPLAIQICSHLDGLPLAIEMAAARLPLLGFANLNTALAERLRWLRSDGRHALPRQQTLRAALEWSHGLLSEPARAVLRRLSVFAGQFALEGAKQVAAFGELDEWAVIDAMAELADRSVLQVDAEEPPHYRLLESTRAYAAERLAEAGEAAAVRSAHMGLMARLGDEAEAAYWTTPDEPWLARWVPWYEDLHLAFQHACDSGDSAACAATLDALFHIDELREITTLVGQRLVAAAALLPVAAPRDAIRIGWCLATVFAQFTVVSAPSRRQLMHDAVQALSKPGDEPLRYRCLMSWAMHAAYEGDHAEAEALLVQASSLWSSSWPARLGWVGAAHTYKCRSILGDAAEAIRNCRAELAFAEQAGSPCQAANAAGNLADALLLSGQADEAVRIGEQVVARARASGRTLRLALTSMNLTAALIAAGDLERARATAEEMVPLAWHTYGGALADHLSLLAAHQGRHTDSLAMLGWADHWYPLRNWGREGNELAAAAQAMKLNEAALGAAACARLRADGERLDDVSLRRLVDALVAPEAAAQRRAV